MQNHPHNLPPAAQRPWYLEPWPWLLMLGPVIVMIAGFHTAWIAFSQQDALVVDVYYKQGKAINRDLRRDSAASRLGMAAALRYDANAGTLTGSVTRTQPAQPAQPARQHPGVMRQLYLPCQPQPSSTNVLMPQRLLLGRPSAP